MPIDPSKPFDLTYRVDPNWVDMRLDQFVKAMVPSMSRTKIQKYIKAQRVEVNGAPRPANWRVRLQDQVLLRCWEPTEGSDAARLIPLDILYEDDHILALNKQPGLVVHPVGKHRHNTLLNALYFRYRDTLPEDQEISLANRLDQHTSGVILVTKHTQAKRIIQQAFEARTPKKTYIALAEGVVRDDALAIDAPLGPALGRTDHCLMGVRHDGEGKPSKTELQVMERFDGFTLLRLSPHTGRPHQLRVHAAYIGHPLVSDDRYGNGAPLTLISESGGEERATIKRYALHAAELSFDHPMTGVAMQVKAPLAQDMHDILAGLRKGWRNQRSG